MNFSISYSNGHGDDDDDDDDDNDNDNDGNDHRHPDNHHREDNENKKIIKLSSVQLHRFVAYSTPCFCCQESSTSQNVQSGP